MSNTFKNLPESDLEAVQAIARFGGDGNTAEGALTALQERRRDGVRDDHSIDSHHATSGGTTMINNQTGETANLTSSIKFCEASASSARDLVGEVETFSASLTAAGVTGEPLRLAGTAMELADQLGTTFDDLGGELQRHTVVAESYQAVGDDAGDKQFNQAT